MNRFVFLLLFAASLSVKAQQPVFEWAGQSPGATLYPIVKGDAFGNSYTVSSFWGVMDVDPGPGVYSIYSNGQYDGYIIKLNSQGQLDWVYTFGGAYNDYVNSIQINSLGEIIVSGTFELSMTCPGSGGPVINSIDGMGYNVWLTSTGVYLKHRQIGDDNYYGLLRLNCSALDGFDRLYLTGDFSLGADFDPGPGIHRDSAGYQTQTNIYVVCLDQNGDFLWENSFGSIQQYHTEVGNLITSDPAGNLTVAASFQVQSQIGSSNFTSAGSWDMLLLRLNNSGTLQWVKHIGGTGQDIAFELHATILNTVMFASFTASVLDIDPGSGQFMVGSSNDYYLGNLDASGNFAWGLYFSESVSFNSITSDNWSIYIGGSFSDSVDFDAGSGVDMQSTLYAEPFILNLDLSGNYNWVVHFADTGCVQSLSTNVNRELFCAGSSTGTGDFDPGSGVYYLNQPDPGFWNLFNSKFSLPLNINEQSEEFSFELYPNPTAGQFTIFEPGGAEIQQVTIANALGEIVRIYNHPSVIIRTGDLPQGVYRVLISTFDGKTSQKQIVLVPE